MLYINGMVSILQKPVRLMNGYGGFFGLNRKVRNMAKKKSKKEPLIRIFKPITSIIEKKDENFTTTDSSVVSKIQKKFNIKSISRPNERGEKTYTFCSPKSEIEQYLRKGQ